MVYSLLPLLPTSLKGLFIKAWQLPKSQPLETRLCNTVTLHSTPNDSPVSMQLVWSSSNTQYQPSPICTSWNSYEYLQAWESHRDCTYIHSLSHTHKLRCLQNADWTLEWELQEKQRSNGRDSISDLQKALIKQCYNNHNQLSHTHSTQANQIPTKTAAVYDEGQIKETEGYFQTLFLLGTSTRNRL